MITHASALEVLSRKDIAYHFDKFAEMLIGTSNAWIYSPDRLEHQMPIIQALRFGIFKEDLESEGEKIMRIINKAPKGWETDDGRIAGVTERSVQETMDL